MDFNTFKCGFFKTSDCRIMCDAVNPTHCIPFGLCALHIQQHTPLHHALKTAPQSKNHFWKKRGKQQAMQFVYITHKHSTLSVALLCTWSFFTVYYNSILCWTREWKSALEELMWGEERAESKYINRPQYLCACMQVMKENETPAKEEKIKLIYSFK